MSLLAVQDFRNYIRDFVQVDSSDISDSLADMWLRQGWMRMIRSQRPWPFYEIGGVEGQLYTIQTVIGQQGYTLPSVTVQGASALVKPKRVTAVQGPHWELMYASQTALESTFTPAFIVSQEPERWSEWNDFGITLWPKPNSVYTLNIRAYREPVDWIGLGAGGLIDAPDDWGPVLAEFVLSRAWSQQTDLEQSSYHYDQFGEGMNELRNFYLHAPMSENLRLNGGRVTRQLPPRLRFPFEGLNQIGIGE